MSGDHGGFCCAECAEAAMRGEQSSCDGGSCRTGTSGAYATPSAPSKFAEMAPRSLAPMGGARMEPRYSSLSPMSFATRGTAAAARQLEPYEAKFPRASAQSFVSSGTGCATCGAPAGGTGATGCACSMPRVVGPSQVDARAMRLPALRDVDRFRRGTGRLAMVAPTRGTGAVYTVAAPQRRPGESDADWRARWTASHWDEIQPTETAAENRQRLDAYYAAGGRGLASPFVPASAGSSSSAGGSATAAQNQQAVINGVVSAVASAGNTVLALVREANQHDADVRRAEAEAAAARIARNDSRESMLIAAVREATTAGYDAQTALRTLRNGDRTGAIAALSAAQGKLAGAIGTATAFPGSTALTSAISSATASVSATATEIDRTAPPDLPPVNPLNSVTGTPEPWYKQPVTLALAGVAALLAIVAGRR